MSLATCILRSILQGQSAARKRRPENVVGLLPRDAGKELSIGNKRSGGGICYLMAEISVPCAGEGSSRESQARISLTTEFPFGNFSRMSTGLPFCCLTEHIACSVIARASTSLISIR